MADGLASLGSAAKRIDMQTNFTSSLVNILTEGLGNLVDADLAEGSAKLQSLQIQQQLGDQSLAIANSSPQTILSLFGAKLRDGGQRTAGRGHPASFLLSTHQATRAWPTHRTVQPAPPTSFTASLAGAHQSR